MIAVGAIVYGVATVLTYQEVAGGWLGSPVVFMRHQFERQPYAKELVEGSFAGRAISECFFGKRIDPQIFSEYQTILDIAIIVGLALLIIFWRTHFRSLRKEFRDEQEEYRRWSNSRCPKRIERLLFAFCWLEYRDAADFAETLRDRYENDWIPQLGLRWANWRYACEVLHALPCLVRRAGRFHKRRMARA